MVSPRGRGGGSVWRPRCRRNATASSRPIPRAQAIFLMGTGRVVIAEAHRPQHPARPGPCRSNRRWPAADGRTPAQVHRHHLGSRPSSPGSGRIPCSADAARLSDPKIVDLLRSARAFSRIFLKFFGDLTPESRPTESPIAASDRGRHPPGDPDDVLGARPAAHLLPARPGSARPDRCPRGQQPRPRPPPLGPPKLVGRHDGHVDPRSRTGRSAAAPTPG